MYFAATDLLTDSCSGGISIFEDGVQVGPVPGNNVLGGESPTQLTPREAVLQWGGGSFGSCYC